MKMCKWRVLFMMVVMLAVPTLSVADETSITYDRVHLNAVVSREVPNDEMLVTFAAERTGTNAAELADTINTDMTWALDLLKARVSDDSVVWQTRAYNTYPNYSQGRVDGWVSSQELVVRSKDSAALTTLVGELQSRLLVRTMNFAVSKPVRTQIEDELIGEAMEAFKRRAELVRKHMEDRRYRIVEVRVSTEFGRGYRPPMEGTAAMARTDVVAQPGVSSGNSELQVSVSGSIEFQLP